MANQELIRQKKLEKIKEFGIDPYPSKTERNVSCAEARLNFEKLLKKEKILILAGRLILMRYHGGATFAHLYDGTDKFQIFLRKNVIGEENYRFFLDFIDIGDFIEAKGHLMLTKTGEKTLEVEKFKLLAKALLPLPEKWHGLVDIETRFRQRYLDLIANPEVRKIFEKRNLIIKYIREFLEKRGFIEVETPILQPIPGGALARPFVTHHHALNMNLYLRIAPELYLKRLIVAGFNKVYEIGRCFRNEGIDASHSPEFTLLEFYQAYANYLDFLKLTEELLKFLVKKINGNLKINYQGKEIDFTPPYSIITYTDAFRKFAGIDLSLMKTKEMLLTKAKNLGLQVDRKMNKGKILDEIFKELIRPKLINPTFIIDYPIELSPLAKRKSENPELVERFQLIIAGLEICNAYSELNDPIEQEERFKEQQLLRRAGDEEAQRFDPDFIEALKYGMPPTAGEGIGIDRLVSILTNVHNLKEVILFPTLRPKK
jgi:lysyl-tRNA synthetase class 2